MIILQLQVSAQWVLGLFVKQYLVWTEFITIIKMVLNWVKPSNIPKKLILYSHI